MKIPQLKKNQKILLIAATTVLLIFALGTSIALAATKKPTVAFYNIPARDAEKIQSTIGTAVSYRTYPAELPLRKELEQGAKPDLLIVPSGQALTDAKAVARVPLATELFRDMTTSVRSLVQDREKSAVALPLLSSHFEIAVNTQELKRTGVKTINMWSDVERLAREASARNNSAIVFAGKDSTTLLDLLGAMTEAINGRQQYANAVELIAIALDKVENGKQQLFSTTTLAKTLCAAPDSPLHDSMRLLQHWFADGLIFREVFSLDKNDVAALIGDKSASIVFMSLSDHRNLDRAMVEKYTSYYFPSSIPAPARAFTAPVYFAVPLKNNKALMAATKQLVTAQKQEALSRATGLAPVLTRCHTADKQATDARHWVASTNSPVAGLSRETALTKAQRDALAQELGALIRFGAF